MSEIMNVWTELFDAIHRLKASDSPDVWTSYANLVQARAEAFDPLFRALEAHAHALHDPMQLGGTETRACSICGYKKRGGRESGPMGEGVTNPERPRDRPGARPQTAVAKPAALCSWHHRPFREECPGCLQIRIRALEAELREKAEAEVERLKAEIREHRCVNDKGEYV